MSRTVLLISLLLIAGISVAQCPSRQILLNKLLVTEQLDSVGLRIRLTELLGYDATIKACPYRTDSIQAALLRSIRRLYALQQDYIAAAHYTQKLISFTSRNAGRPHIREEDLLLPYFWLSNYYDSLRNISAKMRAIDSCVSIALRLNITANLPCIRSLYSRVEYFFDKGDYHRCIKDAELCENMALSYVRNATTAADSAVGEDHALSSAGWYVNSNLALKNYAPLESYIQERIDRYKAHGRKNYLGVVYAQLAEVQWIRRNIRQAVRYYDQSLSAFLETQDHLRYKQTLNSLAHDVYYTILHNDEKALECYRKALRFKSKTETKEDSAEALNIFARIANVYVRRKEFDTAFAYFQKGFDQVRPGANEQTLLNASINEKRSYKKVHYLASLVMDKGDAYFGKYRHASDPDDLAEAIRIYKIADALLNSIKADMSETSSKLFWRYDTRRLYEHAIEACLLQNNMANAFYFFEKSRATLLNDQIAAQHWLGEDDIALMVQVQKKLAQIERTADTISNPEHYLKLGLERERTSNQLASLQQFISERNPLYYRNIVDTTSVPLHIMQETLRRNQQVLLEIFAGDHALYSLLITPTSVQVKRINKELYDSLVSTFMSFTKDAERLNTGFNQFRQTSADLYKLMFDDSSPPKGRIIISPDGGYFPFEALITDNTSPEPVYFVRDHAVSYTYSARYLQNSFTAGNTAGSNFLLGVAPANYAPHLRLNPLTGSDISLKKIGRMFNGSLSLIGREATRERFLTSFSNYRVVQLYTHASDGSGDSSGHSEPVIYFPDAPLYLSELIPQSKPVTRLVVLSACETAGGRVHLGEGVFSFNRGFAAMGIPSSITNLWAVENEPTYRLTELFYKYMAEGLDLDIALQKAKNEFIEKGTAKETLPFYWSATIMMGKTDPLPLHTQSPLKWLIPVIILAVPAFVAIRRWRRKKISQPPFQRVG